MKKMNHAAAAAILTVVSAGSASAAVVYEASSNVFGGLCPTCAGAATTMGDDISLAGGGQTLNGLTWDTSNFGADYLADIRVNLFNVDLSGANPAIGAQFHTQTTQHFLAGGNGSSERSFVDIALPDVVAPERMIYTISVLNNNGSTNWNVHGQQANNAVDEDETLAQADVGMNNELDFIFGDWVLDPNADVNTLVTQRLSMASYQFGLPGNETFAEFTNFTPNVTFTAVNAVPVPAALPLLASAIGLIGFMARRRKAV